MSQSQKVRSIKKVLSSNDIGETGGHQAGIHVPKDEVILSFFPKLNIDDKNPRCLLTFYDDSDERWEFSFIYYNNKLFGGTRNEYRLTRMTKFIKCNNLKIGDELILTITDEDKKLISFKRIQEQLGTKLKLTGEWKVIQF